MVFEWSVRIAAWIVALIFAQTLFFKFTGSIESRFIFATLGMEPWGRYLIGTLELIAVILLALPKTSFYGALLSVFILIPAIYFHITKLGYIVQNDRGLLFGMAIFSLLLCLFILYSRQEVFFNFIRRVY